MNINNKINLVDTNKIINVPNQRLPKHSPKSPMILAIENTEHSKAARPPLRRERVAAAGPVQKKGEDVKEDRDHRIFPNQAHNLIVDKLNKERQAAKSQGDHAQPNAGWQSANPQEVNTAGIQLSSQNLGNGVVFATMKGRRPSQEDAHLVTRLDIHQKDKTYPLDIFGIFDGHGGDKCSSFLATKLGEKFKGKLEEALKKYESEDVAIFNTLKLLFVELGEEFKKNHPQDGSGSTANVAFIFKDNLWVANVGDSRTVLCQKNKAQQLSEDAKPGDEKYKRGIEKRGGVVNNNRINGMLAVGRAIGDAQVGDGINSRPKIVKTPLAEAKKDNGHLVMACDGLWDVASPNQVAQEVNNLLSHPSGSNKAEHLIKKAYQNRSGDNISSIVIDLNNPAYAAGTSSPNRESVPLAPTKENMNKLIKDAESYGSSLTRDFKLRDKIPQSRVPHNRWPAPNPNTNVGTWGPSAAQYPEVQPPSWAKNSNQWKRDRVVEVAKKYIGLPYKHHHVPAMGGLDCSNFTSWIYNYGLGTPRFTSGIRDQSKVAGRRLQSNEKLLPGDLLFIKGPKKQITHVVMYMGKNKIIDATTGGHNNIGIRDFAGWYKRNFSHARRIIE